MTVARRLMAAGGDGGLQPATDREIIMQTIRPIHLQLQLQPIISTRNFYNLNLQSDRRKVKSSMEPSRTLLSLLLIAAFFLLPATTDAQRVCEGCAQPQQCKCYGSKGETGAFGLVGLQGPPGAPGYSGLEGPPGINGEMGERGDLGSLGAKGQRGNSGNSGVQGPPGMDGLLGLDGPRGQPGIDGCNGTSGPVGLEGADGLDGQDGLQGIMGPRGRPGAPGLPGLPGPKGYKGETGEGGINSFGLKGDSGNPGIPGRDGAPGGAGRDGLKGQKGEDRLDLRVGQVFQVCLESDALESLGKRVMLVLLVHPVVAVVPSLEWQSSLPTKSKDPPVLSVIRVIEVTPVHPGELVILVATGSRAFLAEREKRAPWEMPVHLEKWERMVRPVRLAGRESEAATVFLDLMALKAPKVHKVLLETLVEKVLLEMRVLLAGQRMTSAEALQVHKVLLDLRV
ncbi:hypothetical protein BV898_00049 [Hypsibius exemplaris]|uniref:Uncharacterized protein n=1 Tax=Hypsibius exemplaris TaxID=2072580 RepID=A0A1W0XEK2_HYPEX|nr:hypothetical protein BV898_00049 [Hypsibius exemplaris]